MPSVPIQTYEQVGIKEDISDIISNISPTKTPFSSMIGSETIRNTLFQWQEDSLQAVSAQAALEGATAPAATWQATILRNNKTQIFTVTASASGTADVVEKYGRAQELAYQLSMRASELKRNLEYAFVGIGTAQALVTGSDSTARQMNGYQAQISSTTTDNLGTPAVLSEAMVLLVAQNCYINGADPDTLMIKPVDGTKVASWQYNAAVGNRTKMVDNSDKKIVNVVDIYESPYGSLRVVMNRFLHGANAGDSSSDALIFEASNWKKCVLRNWFRQTLAKTGDSTQVQILGEFSLKHLNQKASGLISNLLTT
jgi:hypothetical protein